MKYTLLSLIILIGMGTNNLHAQSSVVSSGKIDSGSDGSISYTVGQIVYKTNQGTEGSVLQGVQQPFEISVITGLENTNWINLECKAFPNPVTQNLTLELESPNIQDYHYQLYTIDGRLIEIKTIVNTNTIISMSNLTDSIYLLKVLRNNQEVKTFKIVKNN